MQHKLPILVFQRRDTQRTRQAIFNSVVLVKSKLHPISSCLAGHESAVTDTPVCAINLLAGAHQDKKSRYEEEVPIPLPLLSSRLIHKAQQDRTRLFCVDLKISFVFISTGFNPTGCHYSGASNQASPVFKQRFSEDPVALSQTFLEVRAQG